METFRIHLHADGWCLHALDLNAGLIFATQKCSPFVTTTWSSPSFFPMYQQGSFRSLNRSGQVTTLPCHLFLKRKCIFFLKKTAISLSFILVAWNNTPRYSLDWFMRLWVRVSVCAYVLSMRTPAWKAHRGSEAQWHGEMFFETGLTQSQQRSLCLSLPRAWIASLYHHTWLVA